jgi:pantoate--beta-alanine ligase
VKIVRTIGELDHPDVVTGFVPTMGALHEGHLSLIRAARAECERVVVSLFVNPTQFGPTEDFTRYPRDEAWDGELASDAGADVLFSPSVEEIYRGRSTWVEVEGVSEDWEGARRPGHFRGVATVVAKLFNIVAPTRAYFGLKDYQQCRVIARMVEDLNIPVSLSFLETIREPDGLALSSRNRYLCPQERALAPLLYEQLLSASAKIRVGIDVDEAIGEAASQLEASGFNVDYFALVDGFTLQKLHRSEQDARLIAAAKLGQTRLIDNISLGT